MSLVTVLVVLVVVGFLLWVIQTFVPMDAKVKNLMSAVVVLVLLIWILRVFGLLPGGHVVI